MFVDIIKVFIS